METGFAPEWVELQKDIRKSKDKVRDELKKVRQTLGPAPLTREKHEVWMRLVQRLTDDEVKSINKMIEKFNLIVPNMNNQMFRYKIDPDEDNIYKTGYDHTKESSKDNKNSAHESISNKQNSDNKGGLFSGMFQSLFNK